VVLKDSPFLFPLLKSLGSDGFSPFQPRCECFCRWALLVLGTGFFEGTVFPLCFSEYFFFPFCYFHPLRSFFAAQKLLFSFPFCPSADHRFLLTTFTYYLPKYSDFSSCVDFFFSVVGGCLSWVLIHSSSHFRADNFIDPFLFFFGRPMFF